MIINEIDIKLKGLLAKNINTSPLDAKYVVDRHIIDMHLILYIFHMTCNSI